MFHVRWQHSSVRSNHLSKHIHDLYLLIIFFALIILKNIIKGILFSKMPQCCAVPMCANKTGGHKFPTEDKSRLKQWLVAIRRDKFTPTKNSLVCKSHFTADDYQLPKDSVLEKRKNILYLFIMINFSCHLNYVCARLTFNAVVQTFCSTCLIKNYFIITFFISYLFIISARPVLKKCAVPS